MKGGRHGPAARRPALCRHPQGPRRLLHGMLAAAQAARLDRAGVVTCKYSSARPQA